jgi:hypothetical protein
MSGYQKDIKTVEKADALKALRNLLSPGDTVYTILRHVSSSGMTRYISTVIIGTNQPLDITYHVAKILDLKRSETHEGAKVCGCGMDMGFHVVYELSRELFPNGFTCIGKDPENHKWCPSNDHANGDTDYTPHHHYDGGYALNQRWL